MDFEDILKPVGAFNAYQKRLIWLFLVPVTITSYTIYLSILFQVMTTDHWCRVPELQNLNASQQRLLSIPKEFKNGLELHSKCSMYDLNYTLVAEMYSVNNQIPNIGSDTRTKECSHGWTYDQKFVDRSAVTQLDLVCENDKWPAYILTLDSFGKLLGTPALGYISDNYGRKFSYSITVLSVTATFISPIVIENLTAFAIVSFVKGFFSTNTLNSAYLLLMEMVGSEHRSTLLLFPWLCGAMGSCFVALLAYICRDWISLSVFCVLLSAFQLIYIVFIPESPRWLLSKRKYVETFEILSNMAKVNKRFVPDDFRSKIQGVETENELKQEQLSTKHLFTNKNLRFYMIIASITWIAITAVYSGSLFNFENFSTNPYLVFALLSISEIPAVLLSIYLMNTKIGRRWTISLSLLFSGICCSIPIILPSNWTNAITVMSIVGRGSSVVAFVCIAQIVMEMLPTPLRSQGLGLSLAIAGVANFALPYLAALGRNNVTLPMLIFGLTCIAAGLLSTLLPETRNKALPQTMADFELLIQRRKFFCWSVQEKADEKRNETQSNLMTTCSS